ncbi:hypothetical protein L810_1050 [Burkholderia sp. AU4i]|nr:hypothetical protein L810_1050 [Burkholderia sp. AU4i]MDW9229622.1 hypothetical protein [Burkholderia cepacia]
MRATRGAECEAGREAAREAACKARVPHRPMHYRLPEFAREGVRPLWGH